MTYNIEEAMARTQGGTVRAEQSPTRAPISLAQKSSDRGAQLDSAHVGPRKNWWARFKTLLAILGPGLIVMVGDNDAGAFGTYTQAGQNYGIN